ncbi:MAG TPA: ATPase [Saprospiraceae bacterium]|nr:ATPase [Saprospiraceae bacterium]
MSTNPLNILCISRYFKGEDFMRGAKEDGHNVFLLTSKKLEYEAWPWESIDETFYMVEDEKGQWPESHLIGGLAHKMRSTKFDIFVALDDFDVEHVAFLREYFRIPGMGETTARYFRDKLAMRIKAQTEGVPVPQFTALFHDADINHFADTVPAPWLVKPRMQASATGITKIYNKDHLWEVLNTLGGERHEYLLERFAPGAVYHVDSLTYEGKVIFSRVSQYLDTPFEVAHGGGIFRSHTIEIGSPEDIALQKLNVDVMKAFGMQYSASHSEFIKCNEDGKYYFLETASRVGGANLAEMVQYASGINLWSEWAKIEAAVFSGKKYKLPKVRQDHAGIIVSLSKYEHPDNSSFEDKEIVWRMNKKHHIGLILLGKDRNKILHLLDKYCERIRNEFHASLPPSEKPTS